MKHYNSKWFGQEIFGTLRGYESDAKKMSVKHQV